jgi:N-acetylneuraminic acid mutarotase
LLIIGGRETFVQSNLGQNEMYDPTKDRWTIKKSMPTNRSGLAAAALNDNIFVMGGEKKPGSFDINEKYNIQTNTWTSEPPMPTSRLGHDAVELNGKIYVMGGKTSQGIDTITDANEVLYEKGDDKK